MAVGHPIVFYDEFSLAPNGTNLRIYVGDASSAPARFYRVDNANVAASTLFSGGANVGWMQLSNATNGTPGFASFNYCSGQCSYDMPVYSPPGAPNIVYIGGAMQYGELGGRSNGRAVQRSEDAGVNFTDMTIDARGVSRHPDQHAMAATPLNPNLLFTADDGGLWRTDGAFSNVSSECAGRGLAGNNLIDCTNWLSKVPTTMSSLNRGLGTLQYQSLSVSAQDPLTDIMGGTQDNGTHAFESKGRGNGNGNSRWFVTIFGDGGQSGISSFDPNIRFHTFFDAQIDTNFRGTAERLEFVSILLHRSGNAEGRSFYILSSTIRGSQPIFRVAARGGHRTLGGCGLSSSTATSSSEFRGSAALLPATRQAPEPTRTRATGYIVAADGGGRHGNALGGLRRGRGLMRQCNRRTHRL